MRGEIKMANLDFLTGEITLGQEVIPVVEQPHKQTKAFIKLVTGLGVEMFTESKDNDGVVDFITAVVTEKPYEALKLFVPQLTEEQFDEGTNRQIIAAYKEVLRVNGVDLTALGKKIKPLMATAMKTMAERAKTKAE